MDKEFYTTEIEYYQMHYCRNTISWLLFDIQSRFYVGFASICNSRISFLITTRSLHPLM